MDQLTNGNPQIAALAKAVRKRADYLGEEAFAQQDDISGNLYRLARDVAELGRVLANIIEGKPLDRAFGAPGDWGYDHPIGQALAACYASARALGVTVAHQQVIQPADAEESAPVQPCRTEQECTQPDVCRYTHGCERVEDAEEWRLERAQPAGAGVPTSSSPNKP